MNWRCDLSHSGNVQPTIPKLHWNAATGGWAVRGSMHYRKTERESVAPQSVGKGKRGTAISGKGKAWHRNQWERESVAPQSVGKGK